jgi:hypothetical protein
MENSKDTIGNRTRHLPACSILPQLTAPPLLKIQEASSSNVSTNLQNNIYNYKYI